MNIFMESIGIMKTHNIAASLSANKNQTFTWQIRSYSPKGFRQSQITMI